MSNTPHYLPVLRKGAKYGDQTLVDGVLRDGLLDAYGESQHMGISGEQTAEEHKIGREEQDDYAVNTYKKAQEAEKNGWFQEEIAPIEISGGRGKPNITIDKDDETRNVRYDFLIHEVTGIRLTLGIAQRGEAQKHQAGIQAERRHCHRTQCLASI